MGIVKRQGIKHSMVSYTGTIIGILSTLFIYPAILTAEEWGLLRFVLDTALLVVPFALLGLSQTSLHFFPNFKNEKNGHNGFLFLLLLGASVGSLLFLLAAFIFQDFFYQYYSSIKSSQLFLAHLKYIPILSVVIVFMRVLYSYCINFKRIAIPSIFNSIYIKLAQALCTVAYYFQFITLTQIVWGMIAAYALSNLSYIVYIRHLKQLYWRPNFSFLNKVLLKDIGTYSFYSIFGGIGTVLATRIDTFMLATLGNETLKDAGLYTIPFLVANTIAIPTLAILNIIAPLISQAWKDGNLKEIQKLYSKSSLNLLIVGLFILVGVWVSVDELYQIIPNGQTYAVAKYAILILGIGKLFDMATSVNQQIIGFSEHFRFNFYAILALAVLNIIWNLVFIPIYQVNGAALATALSLFCFNFLKFGFIWKKMKMQPFSYQTIVVLLIGLVAFGAAYITPDLTEYIQTIMAPYANSLPQKIIQIIPPFCNLLLKSIIVTLVYGGLILLFKPSPDINGLVRQVLRKIKR